MQARSRPLAPAAAAAVLAMLWLSCLPAATGADLRTVAQFSDGSSEVTSYFGPGAEIHQYHIDISRKAVLRSAELFVEGLPGQDGEYPSSASLRLGTGTVWDFGAYQYGTGEMGRQATFTGGQNLTYELPAGGGSVSAPGLLLPSAARIKEASLELSATPGLLPPRVYSQPSSRPSVFWGSANGTIVQASVAGDAADFTGRDAVSGAVLRSRRVELGLPAGAFVAEIQYAAESDRAALLLPGEGVLVVNLTTGQEQGFFTGPDAASLEAMEFSGSYLAVLGRGWAAVKDLVGGAEDRVNSTDFPQAAWYQPTAVGYHPESRRLVTACRGAFPYKAISVFRLEDRTVSVFSDSNVTSNLASMVLVPEKECALLGLSGRGSVNGWSNDHVIIAMSLADGAVSYIPAFEELRTVNGLRRQGGLVCALGDLETGGEQLVLIDATDWSWRTFPGTGSWDGARSWAYDVAGQRLLTATYSGNLEVFELDFALEAGTAWQLPEPGAPVPGYVTKVLAQGPDIIAGTDNGLTALGPDGRRNWTIGCGRVDALARDPLTGHVVAAAVGGLRCEPGWGIWDRRDLELLELDLSGPFPVNTGRSVQLPQDWFFLNIEGIAPCALNGTVFLAVSAYNANGLYELRPDGSFYRIQTPSASVGALALSPDGRTLYAACSGAGMLVLDIGTGAQELLTPFSEAALLSPSVVSIDVDESGGVLVGQYPGSGYFPGGVSLLERSANGTLETVFYQLFQDEYVRSATRDPGSGRIFVGADSLIVINETDGTRRDFSPGERLSSLDWSAQGSLLAGAGSGAAFGLAWMAGPPSNLSLDIGDDGSAEWSRAGALEGEIRVDLTSALTGYLAAGQAAQRFTEVPIRVGSGSAGLVQLRSLSVVYGLSERVDLREALAAHLLTLPVTAEASVPLNLSATGGGLRLHGLAIVFENGAAPRARAMPEVRVDAGADAPTLVDLSRYFTDDLTSSVNLSFRLDVKNQPAGVSLSLLFGHYLLVDARDATFRGDIRATVTATDDQGLEASGGLRVRVFRAGEYVPPPPYFGTMAWVFGAIVLVLGLLALKLYIGAYRKRE